MPIQYESLSIPELVLEAKRQGIDLTLDSNGKLDWHDRTLTASHYFGYYLTQRRADIAQYLRDHPEA
jgi:hypothetical protein